MNINQALKQKNLLAGRLVVLKERMFKNSRWLKGNKPNYVLSEVRREYILVSEELIKLKTKLSFASQPILPKILKMGELKSYIVIMKNLDVSSGIETERYATAAHEYESAISVKARDEMIEETERQVSELQDEIDKFNATTVV